MFLGVLIIVRERWFCALSLKLKCLTFLLSKTLQPCEWVLICSVHEFKHIVSCFNAQNLYYFAVFCIPIFRYIIYYRNYLIQILPESPVLKQLGRKNRNNEFKSTPIKGHKVKIWQSSVQNIFWNSFLTKIDCLKIATILNLWVFLS